MLHYYHQALFKAQSLSSNNSELFSRIVDFAQKPIPEEGSLNPAITKVLVEEKKTLLQGKKIEEVVNEAVVAIKSNPLACLSMRIEVSKALVSLKIGSIGDACGIITEGGLSGRGVSIENCQKALACLKAFGDPAVDSRNKFLLSVKEKFPHAVGII